MQNSETLGGAVMGPTTHQVAAPASPHREAQ